MDAPSAARLTTCSNRRIGPLTSDDAMPPADTAVTVVRSGTRRPGATPGVDADLVAGKEEAALGRHPVALATQRRRGHLGVAEDARDRSRAGVEPDAQADGGHGVIVAGLLADRCGEPLA